MSENKYILKPWVIYKITNPNGRIYIGKTSRLKNRKYCYINSKYAKKQPLLFNSLIKYGWPSHEFEIIDSFEGNSDFSSGKEMFWIRTYMSNKNRYSEQNGLNLTDGGEGVLGCKHSEEQRKRKSEYAKNNPTTSLLKKGNIPWNKGKTGVQVVWNKGKKGAQVSWSKGLKFCLTEDERVKRFVAPHLGQPCHWKGKKMPKEAVEKMAATKRGVSNAKLYKKVAYYGYDGVFVTEFKSLKDAAKELNIPVSGVCRVANGELKSYKKHIFKYVSD